MPLFVWTILVYSYLIMIALSSFAATLAMLLIDRQFDGTFFDQTQGGDPLLWQHLFWFMGHPEVYIMALPGVRDRERGDPGVRAQADLRLQGDRGGDRGDRVPGRDGVGAPHVRDAAARSACSASS